MADALIEPEQGKWAVGWGLDGEGSLASRGWVISGPLGPGLKCSDGWDLAGWEKGSPGGLQPIG